MSYIPGPIDPELARYIVGGLDGNIAKTTDPADGWETMQFEIGDRIVAIAQLKGYNYWIAAFHDGRVMKSTYGSTWELRHTFESKIINAFNVERDDAIMFVLDDGNLGYVRFAGYAGVQWHVWNQWDEEAGVIFAGSSTGKDEEDHEIVLVGSGGRIEKTTNHVYDHPFYTVQANSPFNGTPILAVARGDGMWVCGGGEGKLAYSSDGINWTLTDSAFDGSCIYHIAFDNVLGWLAVGAEGKVSKSDDGIAWTAVSMTAISDCAVDYSGRRVDHRWLGATAAGGCWMVAGDGNVVATLCECPDCPGEELTWWFEVCYGGVLYSSETTKTHSVTFSAEHNNDLGVRAVSSNGDVYYGYGESDPRFTLTISTDVGWSGGGGGGGGDDTCAGNFATLFVVSETTYVQFDGTMNGTVVNSIRLEVLPL